MKSLSSDSGIAWSSVYALITIGCLIFAFVERHDDNLEYLALRAPVMPQLWVLGRLGIAGWLNTSSQIMIYCVIVLPTFAFLMLMDFAIGKFSYYDAGESQSSRALRKKRSRQDPY